MRIERKITNIVVSANEWSLYGFYENDREPLYANAAERDAVAASLNKHMISLANRCKSKAEFVEAMEKVACSDKFAKYGAGDTEGRGLIYAVSCKLYSN